MFFFFSSRRRHTRFDCDWSSDVCSSDLTYLSPNAERSPVPVRARLAGGVTTSQTPMSDRPHPTARVRRMGASSVWFPGPPERRATVYRQPSHLGGIHCELV